MTTKDYKLMAEVLAYRRAAIGILAKDTVKGRLDETTRLSEIDFVAWGLAHKLAEDNERFDRERFLKAAGVRP